MPVKVRNLDSYMGLDSPILTLTDNVYDLVIPANDLEMESPQLWFFEIPDEAGGEDQNYIELVSNHITLEGQVHVLTVQEAYHAHASDNTALSISWELWTEWPDGVTFPLPELTAQGDLRLSGDATGHTPPIQLTDMRMGSNGDFKSPLIECSATMTTPTLMDVSGMVPHIEGSARSGIRSGDGITPFFEIAGASSATLCYVDAKIPLLTASIELSTPTIGTMEGDLPFPEFSASVSYHHLATLAGNIPLPRLTSAVGVGGIGTLERNIPELRLEASTHVETMLLTGYIPLPFLNAAGTGGVGGSTPSITQEDRFTSYVLRHVR